MSEDRTGETYSGRSFEERVFIRFDAIDTRLESVDTRLGSVEARLGNVEGRLEVLEAKSYDTKPIWERALAEIASLRESMNERFDEVDKRFNTVDERFDKVDDRFRSLDRKFDVLAGDMIQLRTDQRRVECRMDKIETEQVKPS
jgi:chromosome segregation ATPase